MDRRPKPVHVCVPVLKRYDLLHEMLLSLTVSHVQPTAVYVIDNGQNNKAVRIATDEFLFPIIRVNTGPMGLAEAWNWFIENVPEDRIITNDDITFGPDSLAAFQRAEGDLIEHAGVNMCSCFLIRDSCVEKVGLFDEQISPGYAYFEDCDYAERIEQAGAVRTAVRCGLMHVGSATNMTLTSWERREHDRKFKIAQENFIRKWGRMPSGVQGPLGNPTPMVRQL